MPASTSFLYYYTLLLLYKNIIILLICLVVAVEVVVAAGPLHLLKRNKDAHLHFLKRRGLACPPPPS